jgi:hypothetical protein
VQIGLASLTAKILCKKHNSDLSDVDAAGGKTFNALREMRRLANVREKRLHQRWSVFRDRVDGLEFERWCVKTLISFVSPEDEVLVWGRRAGRQRIFVFIAAAGLILLGLGVLLAFAVSHKP